MRRIVLAGLALVAAVTVFEIPTAEAQVSSSRNPWCIRDGIGGRGGWDCSYHNQAQCLASASGAGGWCTTNPNYAGGASVQESAPRQPGRRHLGLGRQRRSLVAPGSDHIAQRPRCLPGPFCEQLARVVNAL